MERKTTKTCEEEGQIIKTVRKETEGKTCKKEDKWSKTLRKKTQQRL